MQTFLSGILILITGLLLSCVKVPHHTNPYDPATPNDEPRPLISRPDSIIVGVTSKSIDLQWPLANEIDEKDFDAYVISRKKEGDAEFTIMDQVTSLVRNSYSDRSISSNTTYLYEVYVRDKGGKQSAPLQVTIRSAPAFAPLGQLPGFMVSQSAANCSRRLRKVGNSQDSVHTLFVLGTSEKSTPMISYLDFKQRLDTGSISFMNLNSFFLDGVAPGTPIKPYTVNGITPLENSIFKKIMSRRDPVLYASDSNPLGKAIASEDVLYHKIKYGAICASPYGDTVFISLVDFFQLKLKPGRPMQLGFAGILRYVLLSQQFRYDTLLELPIGDSLIRDDHYISALETSDVEPALYLAGPGINQQSLIFKWNYITGERVNYGQVIDPEHVTIRVVRISGNEAIVLSTYNDIRLITGSSYISFSPNGYFSNINRFAFGSDNLLYVTDAGNTGISVIDIEGIADSRKPSLVSKWTTFGNRTLNLGINDYLFALGSMVVFTMDGSTIWRTY